MNYPNIVKVIENISADNGGCTADEIELALTGTTDGELWTIAAGEETEQQEVIQRCLDRMGVDISIEHVNAFFNAAFD